MPEQNSSISSFRRFLLRILLPLIVLVSAGGVLFSYFFERGIILKSQMCGAYKVNRILHPTPPDEIPIFGSSRAATAFIPDSLGHDLFNYGLPGTKTNVLLFFMEQECRKQKSRPWIILNLDLEGLTYGLGDLSNYLLNAGDPAVKQLLGPEYRREFAIPFLKYSGRYEAYLRFYLNDRMDLTKIANKGAGLDKNMPSRGEFAKLVEERRASPSNFYADPTLAQRLREVIQAHPERRFVFVISPYHPSCFVRFKNITAADSFLTGLRVQANVQVLDFRSLALPDSMFLNTTHLNYRGAIAFNHVLRDSLRAMGIR